MKKTAWLVNSVFIVLMLFASSVKAAMAGPHLSVSPSSGNYSVNQTFDVTVNVNSGSEAVGGVDAVGKYDASKLELVSGDEASDMVFNDTESGGGCKVNFTPGDGEFSVSCYTEDNLSDIAVNGSLAVLTFKAKATGTATVGFTCVNGATTDSNIIKTSPSGDVINCSENVGGSYVIGESSSDNDNTDPTPTTAKTLTKAGNVGITLGLIIFGAVSLVSATFLKFL